MSRAFEAAAIAGRVRQAASVADVFDARGEHHVAVRVGVALHTGAREEPVAADLLGRFVVRGAIGARRLRREARGQGRAHAGGVDDADCRGDRQVGRVVHRCGATRAVADEDLAVAGRLSVREDVA